MGLGLEAYLMLPVQRLPRYKLLIEVRHHQHHRNQHRRLTPLMTATNQVYKRR